MKNKNTVIIICSVIVGVAAAVAATLVILKFLKGKKSKLESTEFVFENNFEDEELVEE